MVPKLLEALPNVEVVVLCGTTKAHRIALDVYAYAAEREDRLMVLHGPHPSYRGLMPRNGSIREQQTECLRRMIHRAKGHVERSSPDCG